MSKTNKNKTDRKVVYKISCAWYKMMFIPMDETSYALYHHACALDIYTYVVGWVCVYGRDYACMYASQRFQFDWIEDTMRILWAYNVKSLHCCDHDQRVLKEISRNRCIKYAILFI